MSRGLGRTNKSLVFGKRLVFKQQKVREESLNQKLKTDPEQLASKEKYMMRTIR